MIYGEEADLSPEALEEPDDEVAGWEGPEWFLLGGVSALHEETFPTRHTTTGE